MPARREVLAGFSAVAAAGVAGCGDLLRSGDRAGEAETIEIIVTNETGELAQIGVRVEDDGGSALFSRVYRLDSGRTDQSAGLDTAPAVVRVFTSTGAAEAWEYTPDSDRRCDGQDIGITLARDATIEPWYGC